MTLKTALVVDDSKLARITLQRLLEKHDLSVTTAESGIQALDLLQNDIPDVIFMDHLMPELDGFETTQRIKGDPRTGHTPVIMCSGKEGVDNYEEQAISIGACGILSKPPQPDKLVEALGKAENARQSALSSQTEASVAAAMPAEQPAPSVAVPAELEALLDRISALEQKAPVELPSFDGFSSSLSRLEEELAGFASGHKDLLASLQAQSQRLQSLEQSVEAQSSAQADQEPAAALDEVALASRITRDVENTLTPIIEGELKTLEERVMQAVDEAISESKRELDEHLQNAMPAQTEATPAEPPAAAETDPETLALQILPSLRSEWEQDIQRLVTDQVSLAASQQQSALQDLQASWNQKFEENAAVPVVGAEPGIPPDVATHSMVDDRIAQLEARLTERLEAIETAEPADIGAAEPQSIDTSALINTVMDAVREQLDSQDRQIAELRAALAESGGQTVASEGDASMVAELPSTGSSAPAESTGGGFPVIGLLALIAAVIALAKSFQLF